MSSGAADEIRSALKHYGLLLFRQQQGLSSQVCAVPSRVRVMPCQVRSVSAPIRVVPCQTPSVSVRAVPCPIRPRRVLVSVSCRRHPELVGLSIPLQARAQQASTQV